MTYGRCRTGGRGRGADGLRAATYRSLGQRPSPQGTAAGHVEDPAGGGHRRHHDVAGREGEGDDHRHQRTQHPHELLAGGEPGEGPSLGGQRDVPLGDGVEGGQGERGGEPHHQRQEHLGRHRPPSGGAGGGQGHEPHRPEDDLLLGQVTAQAGQQPQRQQGAQTARRQGQAVPPQPGVLPAQPEGHQEHHEARQPAQEGDGREAEDHFGVGDRLEAHRVPVGALPRPLAGVRRWLDRGRRPSALRARRVAGRGRVVGRGRRPTTGSRRAATAAAAKTKMPKTSTAGAPPSFKRTTPGMATTKPASVPSSVSRALSEANPDSASSRSSDPRRGPRPRPGPSRAPARSGSPGRALDRTSITKASGNSSRLWTSRAMRGHRTAATAAAATTIARRAPRLRSIRGPRRGEITANGARVSTRYKKTLLLASSGEIEKNSDPAREMATRVLPATMQAWTSASRPNGRRWSSRSSRARRTVAQYWRSTLFPSATASAYVPVATEPGTVSLSGAR